MAAGVSQTVLAIIGMRDNRCRDRITEVLLAIRGVRDVDVNLHRGRAAIEHEAPCSLETLVGAVVRAGFGAALDDDHDVAVVGRSPKGGKTIGGPPADNQNGG